MTTLEDSTVSKLSETASLHRSFNRSWRALALRGMCDTFDGVEYRRVLNEWVRAGRPRAVRQFIRKHANTHPEDKR